VNDLEGGQESDRIEERRLPRRLPLSALTRETIVLTGDDDSRIAVNGPTSVTCGPVGSDGLPAPPCDRGGRVRPACQGRTGSRRWRWLIWRRKRTFRFPPDRAGGYAMFVVLDAAQAANEH
jgi:hypothetical protein